MSSSPTNAGVSEIATGVQDHGGFYIFAGNPAPIPDDIAVNASGSTLYMTNTYAANAGFFDNGTVTVIDTASGDTETVTVGLRPLGVVVA